jgi:peptidoglycan/LPS O-acetylase OafA/YrhL
MSELQPDISYPGSPLVAILSGTLRGLTKRRNRLEPRLELAKVGVAPIGEGILDSSLASQLQARTPGKRILPLDALRGFAACVVVLHHFRLAYSLDPPRWFAMPLFAGFPSVILFFVLSGYVLGLPFWRGSQPTYGKYLTRRFFRIYVPYAVVIAIAVAVGSRLLFAQLPLSPWFYSIWHTPFTAGILARQFFTMSTDSVISTAVWSLRYEMEISIIFPLICWLIPRIGPWGAPTVAIVTFEAGQLLLRIHGHPNLSEAAHTMQYAADFAFGALLSWKQDQILWLYNRTPLMLKIVILGLTIVGYYAASKPIFLPLSACVVIVFAQHSFIKRFLQRTFPEYLGRISYSLYLVHGTILFTTLIMLYGRIPFIAVFAIYIVLSFITAHLFCVLIEEPSLRLGKRLTQQTLHDTP